MTVSTDPDSGRTLADFSVRLMRPLNTYDLTEEGGDIKIIKN